LSNNSGIPPGFPWSKNEIQEMKLLPSPLIRLAAILACLMLPFSNAMGENLFCLQSGQTYAPRNIAAMNGAASGGSAEGSMIDNTPPSDMALEGFYAAAFHSEYGDTDRDALIRWEIPLNLFVKGETTSEDMQTLQALLDNLKANVPGLPVISFTDTEAAANVVMSFVPFGDMAESLVNYVDNNWGFMNCFSDDTSIRYGMIAIATDVTKQTDRNHLIAEEFVNMLGLTADLDFGPDSIIYQPYTITPTLANMDYEMLNLLYSPYLTYGMSLVEAKAALEGSYKTR
jgi:hypothetical protein